jgi:hypothetical protein
MPEEGVAVPALHVGRQAPAIVTGAVTFALAARCSPAQHRDREKPTKSRRPALRRLPAPFDRAIHRDSTRGDPEGTRSLRAEERRPTRTRRVPIQVAPEVVLPAFPAFRRIHLGIHGGRFRHPGTKVPTPNLAHRSPKLLRCRCALATDPNSLRRDPLRVMSRLRPDALPHHRARRLAVQTWAAPRKAESRKHWRSEA